MQGRHVRFVLLIAALLVGLVASPSQAGKGGGGTRTSTSYKVSSAVVENGPVTTNDGQGAYLGTQMSSTVGDRSVPDSEGYGDWLYMAVGTGKSGRYISMGDPATVGGLPTARCGLAEIHITSMSEPDWYNSLGHGQTAFGDGALRCYTDTRRTTGWIISWANDVSVGNEGATGECVVIRRTGQKQWTASADTTCPSARWTVTNGQVIYDPKARGWGEPAPFTAVWNQQ